MCVCVHVCVYVCVCAFAGCLCTCIRQQVALHCEILRQVEGILRTLPSANTYCLEQQTHRKPHKRQGGFLGISVHLRALEAMLYGTMKTSLKGFPVLSVSPRIVAQYFNLCAKGRGKKKAAVDLVTSYISGSVVTLTPMGHKVAVTPDIAKYFSLQTKKDDLCDCLLQAVAISEWSEMNQMLDGSGCEAERDSDMQDGLA